MILKKLDIKVSEGPIIKEGDLIEFYYKIALSNSLFEQNEFIESTYQPDIPVRMKYEKTEMLSGLFEGLKNMKSGGSVRKMVIPSNLAFGEKGWGVVPPNTDLFIEICLAKTIYDE